MKKVNLVIFGLLAMGFILGTGIVQAADVDMTGRWVLSLDSNNKMIHPEILLTQDGDSLTGTYKSTDGDSPLTGTVDGDEFEIVYTHRGFQATNKGTVTGNMMSGTVNYGGMLIVDCTGEKK
ncbi:MAG: hypothetical protein FP816_12510 [Desulfobacteraceae bacterium]|nr:hypothetical protein [Desulfobacteraceae bacterium]MBU4054306.1 hypothetical protein [Pseudomonadota bacterium]